MSFQAYLDTIKKKTGKTPDDFRVLAEQKGFLNGDVKTGKILAWLKEDFGLGHGHAMAIVHAFKSTIEPELSIETQVARHFTGDKAGWRRTYDGLLDQVKKISPGVDEKPTNSYIGLRHDGKKFAIIQVSSDCFDVGIKLKDTESDGRLVPSGKWNAMVTHRVSIEDPSQINAELMNWLRQAYDNV